MVVINFEKAKNIAHDKRRAAREKEFEPLDAVFLKQIPNQDLTSVEAQRQQVRDKYATIQTQINNAVSIDELTNIVESFE